MLTLYIDCYCVFHLSLINIHCYRFCETLMAFPSLRFASCFIKALRLSFMDSLVLLNVQQQKRQFLAVSSNHQYKIDTVEWFHRSQPTGGGRQLGLSHPMRTETVNTAMAPALLSGTNRRRGCVVRGLTSLYPPVSLIEQKSFLLSLGLV